jgi:hypothetical protein
MTPSFIKGFKWAGFFSVSIQQPAMAVGLNVVVPTLPAAIGLFPRGQNAPSGTRESTTEINSRGG